MHGKCFYQRVVLNTIRSVRKVEKTLLSQCSDLYLLRLCQSNMLCAYHKALEKEHTNR